MDFGEVFAGTFTTIWRHKVLWLFGLIGQLLVSIGSVVYGGVALSAMGPWFAEIARLSGTGAPGDMPAEIAGSFFGTLAGGLAIFLLLWLVSYIVNLMMRAATIDEAGIAWRGAATDAGRGMRAGANRGLYVFGIDLLWYVPLWILGGLVTIGGVIAWIAAIAALASQGNQSEEGGALLGCCGLFCCLLLFGLAVAVFLGTFAPLMYQSAVQGRRSLGAAIAEGWRLAARNFGPMLIFWLLLAVVTFVAGLLLTVVNYIFSFASTGTWLDALMRFAEQAQSNPSTLPPLPVPNTPQMFVGLGAQAVLALIVNSFVQTFGLTMYAGVYRRLAGPAEPAGWQTPPPGDRPWEQPTLPPAEPGGARIYNMPARTAEEPAPPDWPPAAKEPGEPDTQADLGLTVPDEPDDTGGIAPKA